MTKSEFAALHRSDDPLILYNIWDAGSARAVAQAGAKVLATGSHSLAGAQGYDDGEHIPFARLVETASQIADATALPLTVDMESGYAGNLPDLEGNAEALRAAGAIGCNLEDRLIRAGGLRSIEEQSERIAAVNSEGLFVNARTDTFLAPYVAGENPNQPELVDAAVERAQAYRAAGAGCLSATRRAAADDVAAGVPLPSNAPLDPATDTIPVSDVCYLDLAIDGSPAGRVLIELYGSIVPRTVDNFKALALGTQGFGYAGTQVFRVVDGFTIQAGDVLYDNGTGGKSIYGASFERENFRIRHSVPGMVSMINNRDAGPDSRFLIDTRLAGSGYLDDKYVAFGRVIDGMDVVTRIGRLPTRGTKNSPRSTVVITASGILARPS